MTMFCPRIFLLATLAAALGVAHHAKAAIIYATDSSGNVWRYDNMADMSTQTQTFNAGTLVRDASVAGADYANDQDATADLNTGIVYRITSAGDIVSYTNVAAYLANSNPLTLASGVYTGTKLVNGLSYDGNTTGFYSVSAAGTPTAGDINIYNTFAEFLTGTPSSVVAAGYNGATLNFFDPDATPKTTVGNVNFPSHPINAQYYQVAGNGRLEGFANLTEYGQNAVNRADMTGLNAFGGTTPPFLARAAFAMVPEPTSLLLCISALAGFTAIRRR